MFLHRRSNVSSPSNHKHKRTLRLVSLSLFSNHFYLFLKYIYFILVVVGLYFRPAASISIPTLTTTDLCSILIANSSSNTYTYRANVRNVLLCHICCNKVRVSHQTFFIPHTLPLHVHSTPSITLQQPTIHHRRPSLTDCEFLFRTATPYNTPGDGSLPADELGAWLNKESPAGISIDVTTITSGASEEGNWVAFAQPDKPNEESVAVCEGSGGT